MPLPHWPWYRGRTSGSSRRQLTADIQEATVEQAAHGLSGTRKRDMSIRVDVTHERSTVELSRSRARLILCVRDGLALGNLVKRNHRHWCGEAISSGSRSLRKIQSPPSHL